MWIKSLLMSNIRSYENATMQFSRGINVIVGANNSGKSTLLLPLLNLQRYTSRLSGKDVRLGCSTHLIELMIENSASYFKHDYETLLYNGRPAAEDNMELKGRRIATTTARMQLPSGEILQQGQPHLLTEKVESLQNNEPYNFIYPFLSKRKVIEFSEKITEGVVDQVSSNLGNLNAKIDRISNPEFYPAYDFFTRACDSVLGFRVNSSHTRNGKQTVYTVKNQVNIPLAQMGEGVSNILGLIVNLAIAENKLFIIEEPENDIHPKALKALMELIGEKAINNQFVITTHSNIVLKQLGAYPDAKIFRVDSVLHERMPTSTVSEVSNTPEARREILENLGYELMDFDMWSGWLILEESSAEKIIREYLIPWFAPSLQQRLRTYSACSLSEVTPKFKDFNNLFVFLNLSHTYKNKVWVCVDGGLPEELVITKLIDIYSRTGWNKGNFRNFSKHDFEDYYPDVFSERVNLIKALTNKQAKRDAKRELLATVELGIKQNSDQMKAAFEVSFAEIISILREIEVVLMS